MITYLKVRNLAIVEELEIEPGPGLNVLTGETGAGKSLLIDSLEFLRGGRSSSEMIRSGAEKMSAESVFDLPADAAPIFALHDIEIEEDQGAIEVIVKRDIATGGRGKALVNGSPLSIRDLATVMESLLEIHGQSESHGRIAGQTFRELLDAYANHPEKLEEVREAYRSWKRTSAELEELTAAHRDRALRIDLLKYQIDEISAARFDPGEDETLRSERVVLTHARELIEAATGAFAFIDDDESSALAQLARAQHLLHPLSREIGELKQITDELQEAIYRLQDVARSVHRFSESTKLDPERLEQVEERLVTIDRLKKKYGGTIEAALEHLSRIEDEYALLADYESNLEKLQRSEEETLSRYRGLAGELSSARRKAETSFQNAIQRELNDLAMERTTVRISVTTAAEEGSRLTVGGTNVAFGETGFDRVEILIAPNRGEEPKPMQRIASGGELSRIQLAIAAALFKHSGRSAAATLVFDEIDAGIGGRVAEVVGRKLSELALRNQVICVTHLPQIASFGSTHFHVWKEDTRGHTRARIRKLEDEEQRVDEIARMLGGESVPASAVAHARELLDAAREKPVKTRR